MSPVIKQQCFLGVEQILLLLCKNRKLKLGYVPAVVDCRNSHRVVQCPDRSRQHQRKPVVLIASLVLLTMFWLILQLANHLLREHILSLNKINFKNGLKLSVFNGI